MLEGTKKWRMMAVFAHPDDEGQIAGTMAKYSAMGSEVFLVCATRGEMGTVPSHSLLAGKTVAEIREEELHCASNALGVSCLRFLDYQEGSFHGANPESVIEKLIGIIQELMPQVIITFGPDGVYGHRDHIAISRWTTAAFHKNRIVDLPKGTRYPMKLYYTAYPRSIFQTLRLKGIEFRIEIEDTVHHVEGVPDKNVSTVIDVSDFQAQKVEAFRCHRSQIHRGDFRWMIMEGEIPDLLLTERLVKVFPPAKQSDYLEKELFVSS